MGLNIGGLQKRPTLGLMRNFISPWIHARSTLSLTALIFRGSGLYLSTRHMVAGMLFNPGLKRGGNRPKRGQPL